MRLRQHRPSGQALVEFALVFPLFMLVLMSIVVLGLYVFYNQQLENAAREAARYAAVHSASSQCPTVSLLNPPDSIKPDGYFRCDAPEDGWPRMTGAARSRIWGMNPDQVHVTACWSGYIDGASPPNADALSVPGNTFASCTLGGTDPRTSAGTLPCPRSAMNGPSAAYKADGDDKASSTAAVGAVHYPTTVTVYSCFKWTPPMSGFLFVPSEITLRAVISEAIQRQQ
jgi:hypothetical protein